MESQTSPRFSFPETLESNPAKEWWEIEVKTFLGPYLKPYPEAHWANAEYIFIHGCRTGRVFQEAFAPLQKQKCHTIHGLDHSPSMIKYAKEHFGGDEEAFKWDNLALEDWKPPVYPNNPEFPTLVKRVFTIHTLQFERDYKDVLKTIFNTLFYAGKLCGTMVVTSEVFDLYDFIAGHPEWKTTLGKDLVIPDWVKEGANPKLKDLLVSLGFLDVEVELEKRSFTFPTIESCLELYFAWNSAPLETHVPTVEAKEKLFKASLEFLQGKRGHKGGEYRMEFEVLAFQAIKPKPWTEIEY